MNTNPTQNERGQKNGDFFSVCDFLSSFRVSGNINTVDTNITNQFNPGAFTMSTRRIDLLHNGRRLVGGQSISRMVHGKFLSMVSIIALAWIKAIILTDNVEIDLTGDGLKVIDIASAFSIL